MTLTTKDLKAYADGIRYQINRCKTVCEAPSTSDADFDRANSLLKWLPRVEETARACLDAVHRARKKREPAVGRFS